MSERTHLWPIVTLAVLAAVLPIAPCLAAERLVLVTAAKASVRSVPLSEVRRSFLGAVHAVEAESSIPIRNVTNAQAHALFVDRVLAVSVSEYERRLTARTFQSGLPPIAIARDGKELERMLSEIPNAVTYVFESELAKSPGLRLVQALATTP